jgi:hypothetical protein
MVKLRAEPSRTQFFASLLATLIECKGIRPAPPEENGGREGRHRDVAHEIVGSVSGDLAEEQAPLDFWQESSDERLHDALQICNTSSTI